MARTCPGLSNEAEFNMPPEGGGGGGAEVVVNVEVEEVSEEGVSRDKEEEVSRAREDVECLTSVISSSTLYSTSAGGGGGLVCGGGGALGELSRDNDLSMTSSGSS